MLPSNMSIPVWCPDFKSTLPHPLINQRRYCEHTTIPCHPIEWDCVDFRTSCAKNKGLAILYKDGTRIFRCYDILSYNGVSNT